MPEVEGHSVPRAQLRKRKLRYGFKAEAKRASLRARLATGVGAYDPIDCFELARHMDIKVVRLSDLPPTEYTRHLSEVEPNAMSAATIRRDGRVAIWLNDSHTPQRQQSNLAHEIGHVLLDHEDSPPLNEAGCRELHADMEAEADYIGSVLLVPEPAVVGVVRANTSLAEAALYFGVSEQMMRWRVNDSGARVRASRERARSTAALAVDL